MTIEHKDIPDTDRHEPKGISLAAANTIYKSTGSGSGSWVKVGSTELQGISGDGGEVGKHVVSDGANGFTFKKEDVFGTMAITNNGITTSLTAVADTTFNTPNQFIVMTGAAYPWISENLQEITFTNSNRLNVPIAGVYLITTYVNIGTFPSGTAKLAIRYLINGTTYSTRKPTLKSSGAGAEGQLVGFGLISLAANDYVQLTIASDASGTLLIRDANISIHRVG
jgi:hypothetical protein